ncbi:MAG: DinB family protein, partial [Anaerolineales bacterium]|nr:DinB family protein [Anaerolineales bacterium]
LGQDFQDPPDQDSFTDLDSIRAYWDEIEQKLHGYLENLTDDDLLAQPLSGEDEGLYVWQVLLHVVNHGTDHRAQLLRLLNDLGVDTLSQDYMFYIYATAAR